VPIFGKTYSGISIYVGGHPTIRRNKINKNGRGISINGGGGVIEDNDLRDNSDGAWDISNLLESKIERARNLE
jgi:parallel beta-helix repeat protein